MYMFYLTFASTTNVCHIQISTEAPKHERIVCSDAANTRNEDYARSAFIIYDTPEKATTAIQKLNKMRIYQAPKPKCESLTGLSVFSSPRASLSRC